MNKYKIVVSLCTALSLATQIGLAGEATSDKNKKSISKVTTNDSPSLLNANRIDYWITNNARGATDPAQGTDLGLYFPSGTPKSVIYADGFVWSGNVVLPDGSKELRSNGGTYTTGMQAGKITTAGVNNAGTYSSPVADTPGLAKYRVYKAVKDWQNLPEGAAKDALRKDWQEWPWQDGAPILKTYNGLADSIDADGFKVPQILGSQTLWYVANDMSLSRANQLYGSKPIGIELQVTVFGFDVRPLNTMAFMKFKLVNKSGLDIEDMYVSNWSDPDLGGAGDDLVGVDTTLKLGYVYNADNADATYNLGTVPAGGYVFFQGPLVDGAVGDSGITGGVWYHGKKNLPLSSFAFYINGGPAELADPTLGQPAGTTMLNRYQRGLNALGNPLTKNDGTTPTKFPLSGDPYAKTGDLDGKLYAPGDRRLLLSSGPFTMKVGESQEIVSAIIVGQGSNNLSSVTSLKKLAAEAQKVFNKNFIANGPPPAPVVKATGLSNEVVLDWSNVDDYIRTENNVQENYKFEGYKVYQLPTPQSTTIQEAKLIATFDKPNNNITLIKDEFYDETLGEDIIRTAHVGTDEGLKRFVVIEEDAINGGRLLNNREYYFAVTSYNAYSTSTELPNDIVGLGVPTQYENSLKGVITVIPRSTDAGVRFSANPFDEISTTKVGVSDGQAFVKVVDPSKLTGSNYEIVFKNVGGTIKYNVINTTTTDTMFKEWRNQPASEEAGAGEPTFEGLQAFASGPPNDYKDFLIVSNAAGALNPPSYGAFAFNGSGFPQIGPYQTAGTVNGDRPSSNSQVSGAEWGIATGNNGGANIWTYGDAGTGSTFVNRTTQGGARWSEIIPNDFEIRFTAAGGKALYPTAFSGGAHNVVYDVTFELWNVGTKPDASDDVRYFPYIIDTDEDGVFGLSTVDHPISGGDNDPETDWIYFVKPANMTPGQAGYDAIVAEINTDPDSHVYLNTTTTAGTDAIRRLVLVNWNGGSVSAANYPANVNAALPETGTTFRIVTTKPNQVDTKFTFTAPAAPSFSASTAKLDLKNINVFPNPYFGASSIELSKYNRKVTFTHLPTNNVKIKIFTIAGTYVNELVHTNGTQFEDWSLTNFAGVPVASGMYVAYIETAYGTQILKLAVIQETQYLDNI